MLLKSAEWLVKILQKQTYVHNFYYYDGTLEITIVQFDYDLYSVS